MTEAEIYRNALKRIAALLAGYRPDHRVANKQAEENITVYDQVPAKVALNSAKAHDVAFGALADGARASAANSDAQGGSAA